MRSSIQQFIQSVTCLNMPAALQYIFLLLTFAVPMLECAAVYQDAKCVTEEPCFDLSIVEMMASTVSKDLIAADAENILLKHIFFDQIRRRKDLHSCVLHKIIDLFKNVLVKTEGNLSVHHQDETNHHLELIHIMDQLRDCVYTNKKQCNKLYKKAEKKTDISLKKSDEEIAAILQLKKLKHASENIDDVNIQERVMDELKSLHLYMRGKGFRKKMQD